MVCSVIGKPRKALFGAFWPSFLLFILITQSSGVLLTFTNACFSESTDYSLISPFPFLFWGCILVSRTAFSTSLRFLSMQITVLLAFQLAHGSCHCRGATFLVGPWQLRTHFCRGRRVMAENGLSFLGCQVGSEILLGFRCEGISFRRRKHTEKSVFEFHPHHTLGRRSYPTYESPCLHLSNCVQETDFKGCRENSLGACVTMFGTRWACHKCPWVHSWNTSGGTPTMLRAPPMQQWTKPLPMASSLSSPSLRNHWTLSPKATPHTMDIHSCFSTNSFLWKFCWGAITFCAEVDFLHETKGRRREGIAGFNLCSHLDVRKREVYLVYTIWLPPQAPPF